MKGISGALILSSLLALSPQNFAFAQTAPSTTGVIRVCSVRAAAALFSRALGDKIKRQFDATAKENKHSPASVRVSFSLPKSAPEKVKIDYAKDVDVGFNPASTTNPITLSGPPNPNTFYGACDPGKITFTVSLAYRDLSADKAKPVVIRQSFDMDIPGQYL